eukprot:746504-Hanusia_phi.AAC.1
MAKRRGGGAWTGGDGRKRRASACLTYRSWTGKGPRSTAPPRLFRVKHAAMEVGADEGRDREVGFFTLLCLDFLRGESVAVASEG